MTPTHPKGVDPRWRAVAALKAYLVINQARSYTPHLHELLQDMSDSLNAHSTAGDHQPGSRPISELYLLAQNAALLVFHHDVAEATQRRDWEQVQQMQCALWDELSRLYEQFFVLDAPCA